MNTKIQDITKEFFDNLQIKLDNIEVVSQWDSIYLIKIQTEDSWIIIWNQGKNIEQIKKILKMILFKKLWEDIFIHLEVNDYLKEKEEKLLNFIKSKIEYVKKTWQNVKLPFLSSYERKKVHWYVSEINDLVYTKSEWIWKDRRLHIYKKDIWLSIDIDWDNI